MTMNKSFVSMLLAGLFALGSMFTGVASATPCDSSNAQLNESVPIFETYDEYNN
jgi:hypothetical protein